MITDADLWDINEKRKRKGLPPLTRHEAIRAIERDRPNKSPDASHEDHHGGFGHFLLGLSTGFPMGSPMGLAGAAMFAVNTASESAPAREPEVASGGEVKSHSDGGAPASAGFSQSDFGSSGGGGSDPSPAPSGGGIDP